MAALFWHVSYISGLKSKLLVGTSCAIWLISVAYYLFKLRFSRLRADVDTIEKSVTGLVKIEVTLSKPVRVGPGNYFKVSFPGALGRMASFPVTAFWHTPDGNNPSAKHTNITFLMDSEASWSSELKRLKTRDQLYLDGPLGHELHLNTYENVFLAAEGTGIAGLLALALQLTERKYHDDTIKARIQALFTKQKDLLEDERVATGELRQQLTREREDIRRQRDILKRKPLYLDATKKVLMFWTLKNNFDMDLIKSELRDLQKLDQDNVSACKAFLGTSLLTYIRNSWWFGVDIPH